MKTLNDITITNSTKEKEKKKNHKGKGKASGTTCKIQEVWKIFGTANDSWG